MLPELSMYLWGCIATAVSLVIFAGYESDEIGSEDAFPLILMIGILSAGSWGTIAVLSLFLMGKTLKAIIKNGKKEKEKSSKN